MSDAKTVSSAVTALGTNRNTDSTSFAAGDDASTSGLMAETIDDFPSTAAPPSWKILHELRADRRGPMKFGFPPLLDLALGQASVEVEIHLDQHNRVDRSPTTTDHQPEKVRLSFAIYLVPYHFPFVLGGVVAVVDSVGILGVLLAVGFVCQPPSVRLPPSSLFYD